MDLLRNIDNFSNKKEIFKYLEILFSFLIGQGYTIYAIRKKPGFIEYLRTKKYSIISTVGLLVYSCDNLIGIKKFMHKIKMINLFHYTTIYFIVGKKELCNELMKLNNIKILLDSFNLRYIVKNYKLIIGVIEFVDNDLFLYGNNILKNTLNKSNNIL